MMIPFLNSGKFIFFSLFGVSFLMTLVVWILRGLQVFPGMTSGVIWVLLLLTISLAILSLFSQTKRY